MSAQNVCIGQSFYKPNLTEMVMIYENLGGISGDKPKTGIAGQLEKVASGLQAIKQVGEELQKIHTEIDSREMGCSLPNKAIIPLNKLCEATINTLFASTGCIDLTAANPLQSQRKNDLPSIKNRLTYDTLSKLILDEPIGKVIEPVTELLKEMDATLKAKLKPEVELDETEQLLFRSQDIALPVEAKGFGGIIYDNAKTHHSNLSFLDDYQGMQKPKSMSTAQYQGCLELINRIKKCGETIQEFEYKLRAHGTGIHLT